ncbi:hypothetical protein GWK47_017067 [Chionoecetes opilio]|uniref:Uncharacterized protein n=1 Tax=Chionoecetes opilio TaxID=41210 RepID=A0A8J5BYR2_CHIOP|nr:hypothetical protein GWK47_017067 [Chionoecetes opilio]
MCGYKSCSTNKLTNQIRGSWYGSKHHRTPPKGSSVSTEWETVTLQLPYYICLSCQIKVGSCWQHNLAAKYFPKEAPLQVSFSRSSAIRAADGRLVSDMGVQMACWAEYFGQFFTGSPRTSFTPLGYGQWMPILPSRIPHPHFTKSERLSRWNRLKVCHNDILKRLLGLPRWCSSSLAFTRNGVNNLDVIRRHSVFSLRSRVELSANSIITSVRQSSAYVCGPIQQRWLGLLFPGEQAFNFAILHDLELLVVVPVSGEGRKGPAPPPPVSKSSPSTPVSSASSTPSKKGPAPAVPTSTTPSKPRAPSPVDLTSDNAVGESVVSTPTSNINTQITSTPSGKIPAPHPVNINESPVPNIESSLSLNVDIPFKQINSSIQCEEAESKDASSVPQAPDNVEKTVLLEQMDVDIETSEEKEVAVIA